MIYASLSLRLTLMFCLSLFASCGIKDTVSKKEVDGAPSAVNRLVASNLTPASFQSRSQSIINLAYTSLDSHLASSCTLSQLSKVTVTQACSCDGMGVCSVGITGEGTYSGEGSFAFNVVAAGKTSTTGKATFTVTAPPAGSNITPTITAITAKSTTEGVSTGNIPFTVGDADSSVTCANVVATSSNTTLAPLANIIIAGSATNCTVNITPVTNVYGSTNIVLTLTDSGTPLPVKTATASFTLTVNGVNEAPTISTISAQATSEDTATSAIAFTIADIDSTLTCASVTGASSNTTLVSNASIVIGGTAPNCTVTITPNLNQSGSAAITLTVTDNGMPLPTKTATSSFALTVSAINDSPVLSAISGQTTNQNVAKAVAFTISDLESTVTCAGSVSVTSSNTTLVPNANIVVSGTAPNCSAMVTPANNQYGTATLTVTLTDNGTPMPAQTATGAFSFIVSQMNVAPTISAITAKTTNEDTVTSAIAFTIADSDSTVLCSNVTGTSSNTTIVPNANIVVSGAAPNCNAIITPAANYSGTVSITLTLTDNGTPLPALTATSVFTLTINAVNDAPAISAITAKSTDEDVATSAITFTITDSDSSLTCAGSVMGTSSNTALIPNANIVISGTAPNCSAVITPAANRNGSATITLTLTDNGTPLPALTDTSAFSMTVDPVIDLTGAFSSTNLSGVASSYVDNSFARKISFTGIASDEAVTNFEVCLGTASGACDVSSWVVASGYTTSGTAPTVNLGGGYRMVSGVGGAQTFTLDASCSSTNNYYYSVRATNSSSNISNIVSSPAWSFWEPTCLGISTLTQWLDANEPTTITVDTGVSVWQDKSGNGRDVTQGTASKQPAYSDSELGVGLGGVTFNGMDTSLMRNSFIYAQGASTVFTAISGPTVAANRYILCEGRSTSGSNYYCPMVTSTSSTLTGRIIDDTAAALSLPTTDSILFDGSIHLAMAEDTGSTYYTYSDGVPQSQAAESYVRDTSTIGTYRLGARFRTGTESNWFAGTIGEIMVFNGTLTNAQRQKVEGYSAHKWGVNGNLQVAHPYSVSPP